MGVAWPAVRLVPLFAVVTVVSLTSCQRAIPSQYVRQAEHGVTLTLIKQHPETYKDKVVILGGVIVDKRVKSGRVWLLIKNRPVDEDFVPHVPPSLDGPEAGFYWVALSPEGLPKGYHGWARITVVGRVASLPHPESDIKNPDTVLVALYMRGWGAGWGGYGTHEEAWEDTQSAGRITSAPKSILRTGQGRD
jgi:starvation-inducible outer membrane lipoprotein